MKFERTKNSTRTFVFGVIHQIINILCPFLTRTIIIYMLGAEYTGLSGLFTSLLSLLNISELGIDAAIVSFLYKPVAEDDKDTVCAAVGLLRKINWVLGGISLVAGIVIMPFLPYLIKGGTDIINIYWLYIIYLANAIVPNMLFAYRNMLFTVYQRGDMNHKIFAAVEVVRQLLQITSLLLFKNYYVYAAMLAVGSILCNLLCFVVSKRMFPDITPRGRLTKEQSAVIKKKVGFLTAHSVSSLLVHSADNIVISTFVGITAVTIYGNYHYISTSLISFFIIAYKAIQSSVGNIINADSVEKNNKIFKSLWFGSSWLGMWCSTCMLCLYDPFMKLWLGEEFLLDFPTTLLIVLYFHTNAMRQFLTGSYLNAAGLWNKTLLRQILTAGVNLVLNIALAPSLGVTGVVFASFVSTTFIGLPMDIRVVMKDILHQPEKEGYLLVLRRFAFALPIGAVTYLACTLVPLSGIAELAVRALICIVVPNVIVLALKSKSEEFIFFKDRVKMLLKKR